MIKNIIIVILVFIVYITFFSLEDKSMLINRIWDIILILIGGFLFFIQRRIIDLIEVKKTINNCIHAYSVDNFVYSIDLAKLVCIDITKDIQAIKGKVEINNDIQECINLLSEIRSYYDGFIRNAQIENMKDISDEIKTELGKNIREAQESYKAKRINKIGIRFILLNIF